ncbi:hypothetical protein [Streptomyces sp. NPDC048172]|uniref:hypothetical protein n=1 Tax=Streptomyces sp. NPDC048172 TaxID=3365505 RepID=UPI0037195472
MALAKVGTARSAARSEDSRQASPDEPKSSAPPPPPHRPGDLFRDLARTASAFTVAYVSHDARDGHDRSFGDSGVRAARYASAAFAQALNERNTEPDSWSRWRAQQVVVSAEVLLVRLPNGVPHPALDVVPVHVKYVRTVRPRMGFTACEFGELPLRLRRGAESRWVVDEAPRV